MFLHNLKYAFISLMRNPALVFWTLAFPFILALLFNLAFSHIHDYDKFEPFNIAVVDNEEFKDQEFFVGALKTLGDDGEDKMFNIEYVDASRAEELLDNKDIEGYIYFEGDSPKVKIKENGTNQTVLTTVTEQILQTSTEVKEIVKTKMMQGETDMSAVYQNAIKTVTEAEPNIKDESRVMNVMSIEFYTLIAMACMQGAMLSVELTNRCLPNISNKGKRVAVAPTKKGIMLSSSLLAGYTMLLSSLILLIIFMKFVLNVEFGTNILYVVLLSAAGGLAAMTMGMFLSLVFKTNDDAKNVVVVIVTMVGCLFAGMFGGMKIYFDNMLPFINKISPVGLITDGFYSLYYYDDSSRYISNLIGLLVIAGIFFVLSIGSLRRQKYDSI